VACHPDADCSQPPRHRLAPSAAARRGDSPDEREVSALTTSGTTVHTQSVLYHNTLYEVWRFVRGLGAAANAARAAGLVSTVELHLGDCSSRPVLSDPDAAELSHHAGGIGIDHFDYTFFAANLGSAEGHNRLASGASAEVLLIVNPDTYLAPTALCQLLAVLADPTVGVAEARQIPLEHPKCFDSSTGETSWASTCCIATRRSETFEALGGFDADSFPLYCDDVDYSWRVRLAGQRVVHVPKAVVFHDKEPSDVGHAAPTPSELYYSTYARLMLATKWDRPDVVEETVRYVEATKEPDQVRALHTYRERRAAGTLPAPVAGAGPIAQFIDGNYARHRF